MSGLRLYRPRVGLCTLAHDICGRSMRLSGKIVRGTCLEDMVESRGFPGLAEKKSLALPFFHYGVGEFDESVSSAVDRRLHDRRVRDRRWELGLGLIAPPGWLVFLLVGGVWVG